MDHPIEDYYDMPAELLPSANFAGRPTSDISMLDGLWTMIISSSSSSEDGHAAIVTDTNRATRKAQDYSNVTFDR
jgi:hypothetical protein